MRITATFLDEISTDIPHQNWGVEEWDKDFQAMKDIGIDTVVMIRCGLRRFMTYPSKIIHEECGGYLPPVDLVDMFLTLAEKYDMRFFFGGYVEDPEAWNRKEGFDYERTLDLDKRISAEAWERYGHRKAFKGWYLSKEIGIKVQSVVDEFVDLGRYCKEISGGLPVMVSPGMMGRKAFQTDDPEAHALNFERHYRDWDDIMKQISGVVDIIAFQDGHVEFWELPEVIKTNKALADKYGIECWTNSETFDRDMPFRFPPIKWEKLLLKLECAEKAGITNAITFEFSHFMSPNSFWPQAGHLYNRYKEYLKTQTDNKKN